jgi:hypothetical protein
MNWEEEWQERNSLVIERLVILLSRLSVASASVIAFYSRLFLRDMRFRWRSASSGSALTSPCLPPIRPRCSS